MTDAIHRTVVEPRTVAARLGRDDWLICDVRHQLADPSAGGRAYAAAHLPGAVFLHLDHDLSGPTNGLNGRHPLPDRNCLADLFGRLGIDSATQVVAYDDAGGMVAARLWFLLRWLGHERVALLDGGFQAWQAAGLPVVTETANRHGRVFPARGNDATLATAGEVLDNLRTRSSLVVDARSPDRFRGENEILDPVGGHIPGAVNRFFRDNLDSQGRMKSPEALRAEFASLAGACPAERIIHQCGSGVSACLNMVAMVHAGLPAGRLYAGSWSEWCSSGTGSPRPVAVGPS